MSSPSLFLTAEWRHLVMLSWRAPSELTAPKVPRGTTLDTWQGDHFVSLLGLLFRHTRVFGVAIPFHRDFEEVNLRFYVRRDTGSETRRGVCFLRELVPLPTVALTARLIYNEPYLTAPMTHRVERGVGSESPARVEYSWRIGKRPYRISGSPEGASSIPAPGSHEEFISHQRWGYTRQRDGGTVEYTVEHERWPVSSLGDVVLEGDFKALYGDALGGVLSTQPDSALFAAGSPVEVYAPTRLK